MEGHNILCGSSKLLQKTPLSHGDRKYLILNPNPTIVSKEANDNLLKPIKELELHHIVFLIIKRKAPSLDGFYIEFFQMAWEIIKKDLLEASWRIQEIKSYTRILICKFSIKKFPKKASPEFCYL